MRLKGNKHYKLDTGKVAWNPSAEPLTHELAKYFFVSSVSTYLTLVIIEQIKAGFVSNYLNINYILIIMIATGLTMLLTDPEHSSVVIPRRKAAAGLIHLISKYPTNTLQQTNTHRYIVNDFTSRPIRSIDNIKKATKLNR